MSKYSHYYPLCLGSTMLFLGVILGLLLISNSYQITFHLIIQSMFLNIYSLLGFIIIGIGMLLYFFENKSKIIDHMKLKTINKQIDSSRNSFDLSAIENKIFEYLSINYGKPFSSQALLKRKAELSIVNETITESNLKEYLEKLYKRGFIKRDFIEKEHYYYVIE